MSEVLRHQLQDELCRDLHRYHNPTMPLIIPHPLNPTAHQVLLRVLAMEVGVPELRPWDHSIYFAISIGQKLVSRTASVSATPHGISLRQLEIAVILDEDCFRRELLVVECFAEREVSEPTLLCEFRLRLADAIQIECIGRKVTLEGRHASSQHGECTLQCIVSADDEEHIRRSDDAVRRSLVLQRQQTELADGSSVPEPLPVKLQQQIRLGALVSELRGDSSFFLKTLTAQLQSSDLASAGFKVSDVVTRVRSVGAWYDRRLKWP